jgi:adenosylcobinamide-GDP ribazoletransferase
MKILISAAPLLKMPGNRFLSTFSLVSRIPVKFRFSFDPSRSDFYLPLVGVFPALSGAAVFAVCRFLDLPEKEGGRILSTLLILLAQYLLFNLFHLDGLMDSADAFFGTVDAEKRHAILKDSRVGVYGFFAGAAGLGLKTALLYALLPILPFRPGIFAYPIAGRFASALIPCVTVPAKSGGLGALVKDSRARRSVLGCLAALLIWAALGQGLLLLFARGSVPHFSGADFLALAAAPFTGALSGLYFARLYRKSLGGYTGDALGASVECGELLHLAALYGLMTK